jgi:hypothetical protein
MSLKPLMTFGQSQLQPYYDPKNAREIPVNLVAGTYLPGQVLGQVTDVPVDAVQTITTTGSPTGGTFTLAGQPITYPESATTDPLSSTCTVAQMQAAMDALYGVGNTICSGTALPAGSIAITFTGDLAAQPVTALTTIDTGLTGGSTPHSVVTQTTVGVGNTGSYGAYATGHGDGTQLPKGVLRYGCTVDSAGNISISNEIPGLTQLSAPMFWAGTFRTDDLVGLDSGGLAAWVGAHLVEGTIVSGVVVIPA